MFSNKILTSARNGELIVWDLNKSGTSKYGEHFFHIFLQSTHFFALERRSKDHIRSIHAMSVSHIVHHYCITGSADGDMRVWVRSLLSSWYITNSPAGPSGSIKIPDENPPPNFCPQCCIFPEYLATTARHRRPRQWQYLSVSASSPHPPHLHLTTPDGTSRWANVVSSIAFP